MTARLHGAADGLRERAERPVEPVFRAEFERDAAISRRALGEAAFAAAWVEGRRRPIEEVVAEALALRIAPLPPPRATLTPRETEILHLLAGGMSDAAVAGALFISVRTVEHHVARILAKFSVQSRSAAVAAAREARLVPPA